MIQNIVKTRKFYTCLKLSRCYISNRYSFIIGEKLHRSENTIQNFHSALEILPQYMNTIVKKNKVDGSKNSNVRALVKSTDSEIHEDVQNNVDSLLSIFSTYGHPILHDRFYSDLIMAVSINVSTLPDNVITSMLYSSLLWIPYDVPVDSNLLKLLTAIDLELIRRLNTLSQNDILFICDIWYWYFVSNKKMFTYYKQSIIYLISRIGDLEPFQFTQTLFYQCHLSTYERGLWQFPSGIESKLSSILKELTINELGIISYSLFKSRYQIKNVVLLSQFVDKFLDNLNNASNITIAHILKFLSQSLSGSHRSHYELCEKILGICKFHFSSFDNYSLIRLLNLGNHIQVFDDNLQENILRKFTSKVPKLRLKDLESILLALLNSSAKNDDQIKLILEIIVDLRSSSRINEKGYFCEAYLTSVYYLACLDYCCWDLISEAVEIYKNKKFSRLGVQKDVYQANKNYEDDLFRITILHDIEHVEHDENCQFPSLSDEFLSKISKDVVCRIPTYSLKDLTRHESSLLKLNHELQSIFGGKDFTFLTCVLPHFAFPDIVFCTRNGLPVSIPQEFCSIPKWKLKWPFQSKVNGLEYNAVILASGKSFTHKNQDFKWTHKVKVRQLEKIGFKVSVVSFRSLLYRDYRKGNREIRSSLRTSSLSMEYL